MNDVDAVDDVVDDFVSPRISLRNWSDAAGAIATAELALITTILPLE